MFFKELDSQLLQKRVCATKSVNIDRNVTPTLRLKCSEIIRAELIVHKCNFHMSFHM